MMAVTILVTMMIMTIMMMAMNDHTLAMFVDTYTLDAIRSVENDGDDDGDNDDGTDISDTVGVNNLDSDKSVDDGSDDYYSDGGDEDEDDNDDDDGNDDNEMSDTVSGN